MSDVTVVISNTGPQGVGVPAGGTTGQSLVKLSNTDYATTWSDAGSGSGTGTVTSVGLSLPGLFTVSNSPVTTAGTLTAVLATQQANRVLAGPATGADAAPTFRALVGADIPLATDSIQGALSAADFTRLQQLGADDSPSFAGLTITGTAAVSIPHIHGDIAGSVYIHVKNLAGVQLTKGTPVRVVGAVGDTTTLEVAAADAASAGTMPAIGILADTLAVNGTGHAVVAGELTGLATGSYSIGQALYVASGGGLTGTKPTTGTIQQVAIVGRVNASTGSVTVTIAGMQSPNWDTAYSERLRWDGGATGLDAATGRTSLGLGTLATQSGTFSGTSSGTNTGDVSLAASVADVLSLAGQELQADDPGGDRILFWDDSEGRLRHLSLAGGLVIEGTTLTAPVEIGLACSDEDTALTTGAGKISFRLPYAMTLTAVRASVKTAPTGSTLVVDINENGTSVLSTKLSIDATEKSSTTAATAAVISDSALADDAEITVDIDQIGATIAGAGLKVWLIGRRA